MRQTGELISYQRQVLETIEQFRNRDVRISWLPFYIQGRGYLAPIDSVVGVHLIESPFTPLPGGDDAVPGVASIGGDLYTVVDMAALLSPGRITGSRPDRWLMTISRRIAQGICLRVEGTLDILDDAALTPADREDDAPEWCVATYRDTQERVWRSIDLAGVVRHVTRTRGVQPAATRTQLPLRVAETA